MTIISSAFAADASAFGRVVDPIISNIVYPVISLLFVIALVVFAYGVFQMIWNKTDADAHTKGRYSMLGGVIGMFIMLSAWGIINLISSTVTDLAR